MSAVRFYHGTSTLAQAAILRDGFRDGTGLYLTAEEHSGVWLSDRPLDENEGACSDAYLFVEIDARLVEPYEWVNEWAAAPGMPTPPPDDAARRRLGYREFLVPAAILNAHAVVTLPPAGWPDDEEPGPRPTEASR